MTRTIVMTGTTSGLGLQTAKLIAQNNEVKIITGARNPNRADDLKQAVPAEQLEVLPLDLADLQSVRQFAEQVQSTLAGRKIDALALNAGLQFTAPPPLTENGLCTSFVTNHLGHFLLCHLLLNDLAPSAIVASTASGTHHPDEKLANMFGFRGAVWPGAARVARGELWDEPTSDAQKAMDLYATSKLCNIYFSNDMSRRKTPARFVAFDPGLMAGTGLARQREGFEQWAWRHVLPLLSTIARTFGARMSKPELSAKALAQILSGQTDGWTSGDYVDFRLGEADISQLARQNENAVDLYNVSAELTGINPLT